MLSDIKVLKFVNGEVVLAQVVRFDEEKNLYEILNPITIQVVPTETQGMQVMAQPWPQLVDDATKTVQISGTVLMLAPYTPMENLRNMYNQQFGSGLVLPSKKLEY